MPFLLTQKPRHFLQQLMCDVIRRKVSRGLNELQQGETMTTRNSQCSNCGHLFSDEHPYYSEDFAGWYSRHSSFLLRWCYHCSYVSSYVRPTFIKVIKLPGLRLKNSIPIGSVDNEPLWKTEDKELGLFAGSHLMRMVWHCLNARIELEQGESESKENVVHLALEKLPPREVALMIFVTSHGREIIPLEQQIQVRCIYKRLDPNTSI